MTSKNSPKFSTEFYCEKCDYYAKRQSDLNKHFKSKKHNTYKYLQNTYTKFSFDCECGKVYKHRQSLNNHKKHCTYRDSETIDLDEIPDENTIINPDITSLLIELVNTNKDLKEQIIELAKEPKTVIKNQTTNNSFNLNNFLNIQCRDAMNLSEFLEQIQITFQDLLYLGNHGFVESFKDTFIRQLRTMDQTKRPIHCTDQKRKAVVVKENDKWEKENTHEIIHTAVDKINRKQISAFSQHAKNRDKDFLADDTNLENNSKIIIEMCGYNQKTADAIHKKIMKHIAETSSINKQLT